MLKYDKYIPTICYCQRKRTSECKVILLIMLLRLTLGQVCLIFQLRFAMCQLFFHEIM
jgi:hypothetical protein